MVYRSQTKKKLLLSGLVLMGLALMLLMIPRTMPFVLMLMALFGLGMALLIPILATMVRRQSLSNTGAVLGVQNAVNSLGQALGPLAGGLLFTLSIHLPYLLAGMVLLGSTLLLGKVIEQEEDVYKK